MKALVTVKRVLDPYVRVMFRADASGVDLQHAKMTINPFDEIALEAAVRLRESAQLEEVVVLSVGSDVCQETLRHALALGANRAILLRTNIDYCPLNLAKIMRKVVLDEAPDLVLMGKQSIDGDHNQTPQMLASLLNWPQALFASTILMDTDTITVTCECDYGLSTVKLTLPAVVSVDLRLNEPRYVSLPNIMQAKRKPLDIVDVEELNLTLQQHLQTLSVTPPPKRPVGIQCNSLDELLSKLQ